MSKASDSDKKNEKTNAFSGFLRYFYGNFVVLLLGFVSLPLITRVMSREEYGRTGMFTSAVTILYIFAILGMDQAYIRYYYREGVDRKKLMGRCVFPAFFIVLVLCAVYIIFSKQANEFLFGQQGIELTVLVVAYTIISVFERFLFLDIRMSQNGKLYSNLNILSKILYIALVIIFAIRLGDDFRVVLLAMTISLGLVTVGIGIRFLVKNRNSLASESAEIYAQNRASELSAKASVSGKVEASDMIAASEKTENSDITQSELIRYGLPFILVLLMEWLLSSCDKWALRIWSGYSELGIYNSAMNIMSILLTFKATFVAFWSPVAMEKYEKNSFEECESFFKEAFNITRFLCILAGFGLILFKDVIVFILGSDYRLAVKVIPFLTLMPIFSILFEITNQGIKFVKKNRYLNYASAVAIICNILGNAVLVPKHGGAGAALATGVTYMAYFAIGSYFAEKCYPVHYENKKTCVYAIALTAYAALATFTDDLIIQSVAGLAGIVILCLFEINIIKACVIKLRGMIASSKMPGK